MLVEFNAKEAWQLEQLIRSAGDARQICRAQALLWLAEGDSIEEIADRFGVDRRTVYNWVTRFEQRAALPLEQRLADGIRSGRPAIALHVIDELLDAVLDDDPREHGYQSTLWTAGLLQCCLKKTHHIEVCSKSVRLALQRLQVDWKRPRHVLALTAPHWRQAKGGLNIASGGIRIRSS
jgi:transposase